MLRVISLYLVLCSCFLNTNCERIKTQRHEVRKFPDGFLLGTATASYQVEGAWDVDGKAENIWDHLTHTQPCTIKDCSNGDIADNSYNLYKRDVEMMRELGLDFYRLSISWPRILPTSFPDKINQAGVDYYNNLIDEMLKYNIQPMITLYHWDLPQRLQELGGWANPLIVDWFGDFARVAYELFGDRVKLWITINEPYQICYQGYGSNTKAPGLNIKGIAEYMCAKNLLLAHARAYHIYDKEYRPTQGGSIFIAFSAQWYEPESENEIVAAEETNQFMSIKDERGHLMISGCLYSLHNTRRIFDAFPNKKPSGNPIVNWFSNNTTENISGLVLEGKWYLARQWAKYTHPIFSKTGDFPPIMKEKIAAKSASQGFPKSRLPEFTAEEVEYIRGSSDFFGLNHYSTNYVYRNESVFGFFDEPSFDDDLEVRLYQKSEWKIGQSEFTKYVPWGFYKLLTKIREDYDNPPIYITENGFATYPGLQDDDRIIYYLNYIDAMLDAIDDGSDIRGYTAWSLMDNFEWMQGYTERFGLYEVDYESPERTRTPRKSAFVYKNILRTRTLDMHYQPPADSVMAIDEGN